MQPQPKSQHVIYMERQKTQNSQYNIEAEEQRGLTLPGFKTYYKATVIKRVCYGQKRHQRSMIENPEIHPINIVN